MGKTDTGNAAEPRWQAAMSYDSAHREAVLFGGYDGRSRRTVNTPWAHLRDSPVPRHGTVVYYRDTWVWNGTDWTQRDPAQAPSERSSHAMAYDAARKQIVLFGGLSPAGKSLDDTWVWDGTNWKKMNPVNIPPARSSAAMAYDPNHRQIVMFGGMDMNGIPARHFAFGDTWFWDGTNWAKAEPTGALPESRSGAELITIRAMGGWCCFPGMCSIQPELVHLRSQTVAWMEAIGQSWPNLNLDCFSKLRRTLFAPGDANRALVRIIRGLRP